MPHVKEVLQSIFYLPKGWYESKFKEVEQAMHPYELYAVKFTLIKFKFDPLLLSSEREKVIGLEAYCSLRISLLEPHQVKKFQAQLN